jgi:hypothetical protein
VWASPAFYGFFLLCSLRSFVSIFPGCQCLDSRLHFVAFPLPRCAPQDASLDSLSPLRPTPESHLSDNQKRAQVDEALLQLQNLAYEKAHLVKEIAVARDFRSTTAPIELVSAAAFEADEPSAAASAAAAAASAVTSAATSAGGASDADSAAAALQLQQQHHYHLHRLRHELAARQAMLAQVNFKWPMRKSDGSK